MLVLFVVCYIQYTFPGQGSPSSLRTRHYHLILESDIARLSVAEKERTLSIFVLICGLSGATAECMNNLDFQECGDTGLQHTGLDLETESFNEYVDGLNAMSILLEAGL